MDLGLSGKVVIVTGGASGIGAAVAEALADEGAVPVIVDIRPPDPDRLAALKDKAGDAAWIQTDLTDDSACAAAVAETLDRFGGVHRLVNNAGCNDQLGLETGPDAFRASLNLNLVQVYTMTHLCRDHLRAQSGAIVNVASKVALTGQGTTSAYAAAKGGVLALTREWAAALAPDGVRVNAVVPAEVRTPLYEDHLSRFPDPAAALDRIERRIPLGGRLTTAAEIADTILFLLSDRTSHITGQWIFPDGGYRHLDRAIEASPHS